MSGERLDLEPFQSGNITFAGIKQAGLVYRISPVERRIALIIGETARNAKITIDLSTQLEHDFLVTGISADIKNDDSQNLQFDRRNNYDINYVQVILEHLDRNTQKVLKTQGLFLSGSTPIPGEIILSPKLLYRFTTNLDVRSITITGKPVYLNTPLVFTLLPDSPPRDG